MPAQSGGEYAEALRNHYEAARLETDPHDRSHILHNIGPIHASSGEHARASDHHSQALARNPSPPQAPNNTAVIRHHVRPPRLYYDISRLITVNTNGFHKSTIQ